MSIGVAIRDERPGDADAIAQVITAAFDGHSHSDGSEPIIVEQLRRDGDLALSLVAESGAESGNGIVGHVGFSPVTIEAARGAWFGLTPVSVLPAFQNLGIGAALIRTGLERIQANGAAGCVVLGEPGFYQRFGFSGDNALVFPGAPNGYFMAFPFAKTAAPAGLVGYARAFYPV